jgi:glyoxylase-like metal-dependent hydrolase (beta-lactamase superfamily II)
MQQIDQGIYYETAYSGVTLGAIISSQDTIMIDAPLRAEDGRAWRNALMNLGGNTKRLLINLDAHPDRTLGARVMDCTIIAHQKTALVFRGRPSIFKGQNAESGSEWESYDEAVGTRWALPDMTFTDRLNLHIGMPEIILEHHPGPTPGALWVVIPSNRIVFVGDAILADQPPFLASANIPEWLETIEALQASYKDYNIISGRGGPVPFSAVRAQKEHLKNILKQLEKIARRNPPADATESLIPTLLADLSFPEAMEEQYVQRLRHGLAQYYARHYRPTESIAQE